MRKEKNYINTIIIGAGASGLFCAWLLARAGQPFRLLERGNRAGRKLAISGGGHANFTNRNLDATHYLCGENQSFCTSALNQFGVEKILNFMDFIRLPYLEKDKGKFFLQVPANFLVKKLLEPVRANLMLNMPVTAIYPENDSFKIIFPQKSIYCRNLILCPGSPARPRIALCPDCWHLLSHLQLPFTAARPALAPLIFPEKQYARFTTLSGTSIKARISLPEQQDAPSFTDNVLFTHFGLSGPAILNISLYFRANSTLLANFLPQASFSEMCNQAGRKSPRNLLSSFLPEKLIRVLMPETLLNRRCAELSRMERQQLAQAIHAHRFENLKAGGLARAEVCAGGLSVNALEAETMRARAMPGLRIIGEVQEITGQLGGYNLHWAFATAFCAAKSICGQAPFP